MSIPDKHGDRNHRQLLSCADMRPGSVERPGVRVFSTRQNGRKPNKVPPGVCKLQQLSPRACELHLLQAFALRHYKVNYKMCQEEKKMC